MNPYKNAIRCDVVKVGALLLLSLCAVTPAQASGRTPERFTFPAIRFDSDQYGVSLGWSAGWKAAPGPGSSSARVFQSQSLYLHRPDLRAGMHVSVRELSYGSWSSSQERYEPEKEWLLRSGQRALRFRIKNSGNNERYTKTCLLPIRGAHSARQSARRHGARCAVGPPRRAARHALRPEVRPPGAG